MNTVFPEPPPEDRCAECGASFRLHMEFGYIYYLTRSHPRPEVSFMTDMGVRPDDFTRDF